MNRWKLEYRRKAEDRGFIVYSMPRAWTDWGVAWQHSEVMQHMLMQPAMIERLEAFMVAHTVPALDVLNPPHAGRDGQNERSPEGTQRGPSE